MQNEMLPIKIFCSYAHEDEEIMDALHKHLASLSCQNLIALWHDRQIPPGGDWDEAIRQQLEEADIILLLISSDFIASDYCMKVETACALKREKQGLVTVIPIFARECGIDGLPFLRLQGTPADCNWIKQQANQDKAYSEVGKTVSDAVYHCIEARGRKKKSYVGITLIIILATVVVAAYWYFKPGHVNDWDALLMQGEYQQAQQQCREELDQDPKSHAARQCATITGLMLDDHSPEVFFAKAEGFVANNLDSPYAYAIMAEAYVTRDRWDKAEAYYQQALEHDAEFPQAHFGLGQIEQLQNQTALALPHYEQAVRLAPENRRFRHNLASVYMEQGDYAKAELHFHQLKAIDQDNVLGYVELVYVLLYQGKFAEAFALSETLKNKVRQQPEIWHKTLNKADWFFTTDFEPVYMQNQQDKVLFIKLQYALSAMLVDKEPLAKATLKSYQNIRLDAGMSYLLEYNLRRLQQVHTSAPTTGRLEKFQQLLGIVDENVGVRPYN